MVNTTQTLITGATDGLGRALARLLQAQGERPFLLGRRALSDLDDPLFTPDNYIQADLSRPDCARRVLAFLAAQQVTRLDRLIHNAGMGYYGETAAQAPNSIDQLIDVNLLAPIRLTQALLPHLKRARGQISFVSSVVAIMPGPDYAVYTATKAGLEGFARSLRQELRGQVTVQIMRPGATRTGMHAKMGLETSVMDWQRFPPSEQVTPMMLRQIERGRPVVTVGLGNRLLYGLGYYAPGLVAWGLRRKRGNKTAVSTPSTEENGAPLCAPLCAITGAADGIGRALALRYAQAGYTIIGIDQDADRAAATAQAIGANGGEAHFILADLAQADDRSRVVEQLAAYPPLTVLIHNAGINAVGHFAQLDLARQEAVLDINLRAPLQVTAALLRQQQLAAAGRLVFISSLSRYVSYPGAAVYAATKDGLAAYGRSLNVALPQSVLTVFPGPTRTAHARRYSPDNSREETRMTPEALAEAIFQADSRRRSHLIPGRQNRLFAQLGHWWPGLMDGAMRKLILEKLPDGR
ncbi:MAG: SDR family NAD(P)-dependent oxidoreductase [Chloroflexota bacterium]